MVVIFGINVANKLDFPLLPILCFEREIVIADKTLLEELLKRSFALPNILEQTDLPKLLAR